MLVDADGRSRSRRALAERAARTARPRRALAAAARQLADARYSRAVYLARTRQAYARAARVDASAPRAVPLPGPPRPGAGSRGDGAGHGRHRIHRRPSGASPGAPRRTRCAALVRPRSLRPVRSRRRCARPACEIVDGDLTDAAAVAARLRGRRRRLPHRRDLSRSGPARQRVPRHQRATARATSSTARAPAARAASCTAAPAACTGTSPIRPPTRTRRSIPATSTRTPSSKASSSRAPSGQAGGLEVVIARPIGIYGPGDTALPQDVPRHLARGRFPMLGVGRGRSTTSPTSTTCARGSGCAAKSRRRPGAPTSSAGRATRRSNDARRADRRRNSSVKPPPAAPAGVAVLARRRCLRSGLRSAAHRSRRCIVAASTSTRRAAPSTSRARAPNSGSRPRSTCRRASGAPSRGIARRGCCERARSRRRARVRSPRLGRVAHAWRQAAVRVDDAALRQERASTSRSSACARRTVRRTRSSSSASTSPTSHKGKFDPATLTGAAEGDGPQAARRSCTCTATARRRSGGIARGDARHRRPPARAREPHDDAVVPAGGRPDAGALHGPGDRASRRRPRSSPSARGKVPAERTKVVYLGAPLDEFGAAAQRPGDRRGPRGARHRAGHVRHRHGDAIDAGEGQSVPHRRGAGRSSSRCPTRTSTSPARANCRRSSRRRRATLGVADRVHFLGFQRDVASVLSALRPGGVPVAVGGHAADVVRGAGDGQAHRRRPTPTACAKSCATASTPSIVPKGERARDCRRRRRRSKPIRRGEPRSGAEAQRTRRALRHRRVGPQDGAPVRTDGARVEADQAAGPVARGSLVPRRRPAFAAARLRLARGAAVNMPRAARLGRLWSDPGAVATADPRRAPARVRAHRAVPGRGVRLPERRGHLLQPRPQLRAATGTCSSSARTWSACGRSSRPARKASS